MSFSGKFNLPTLNNCNIYTINNMPRNNKRRQRRNLNRRRNTRPQGSSYTGQTVLTVPIRRYDPPFNIIITSDSTVTSNVGGSFSGTFDNNVFAVANFSQYSAVFAKYRCVHMQIDYSPNNQYSKTLTVSVPGYLVRSHINTTTVLTSVAEATAYADNHIVSLENVFRAEIFAKTPDERLYQEVDTAVVATQRFGFKFFFTGLTASTTYGHIRVSFFTRFINNV